MAVDFPFFTLFSTLFNSSVVTCSSSGLPDYLYSLFVQAQADYSILDITNVFPTFTVIDVEEHLEIAYPCILGDIISLRFVL